MMIMYLPFLATKSAVLSIISNHSQGHLKYLYILHIHIFKRYTLYNNHDNKHYLHRYYIVFNFQPTVATSIPKRYKFYLIDTTSATQTKGYSVLQAVYK